MPRIRTQKPQGSLTTESEREPNNLIPGNSGLGRGTPMRRRGGGLAQSESTGFVARVQSHYQENRQMYNYVGVALGGFILGMMLTS